VGGSSHKKTKAMDPEVSTQEARALAQNLGYRFVETSAKIPENVERAFYTVVRRLRLGEIPEDEKRPKSESRGLGESTAEESNVRSNFGTWKWILQLCSGYERRKNSSGRLSSPRLMHHANRIDGQKRRKS
jgi:hypothetical protein